MLVCHGGQLKTLKIILGAGLIVFGILELTVSPGNLLIAVTSIVFGAILLLTSVNFKSNKKGGDWTSSSHINWSNSDSGDSSGGGE